MRFNVFRKIRINFIWALKSYGLELTGRHDLVVIRTFLFLLLTLRLFLFHPLIEVKLLKLSIFQYTSNTVKILQLKFKHRDTIHKSFHSYFFHVINHQIRNLKFQTISKELLNLCIILSYFVNYFTFLLKLLYLQQKLINE